MNEWKNVCKILLYVNVKSQASKKQADRKKETQILDWLSLPAL